MKRYAEIFNNTVYRVSECDDNHVLEYAPPIQFVPLAPEAVVFPGYKWLGGSNFQSVVASPPPIPPPVGCVYSAISDGGNSGSMAETSIFPAGIGSLTIPAVSSAGKTVRAETYGVLTTSSSPGTVTLKIKCGSAVAATSASVTPAVSKTNVGFMAVLYITFRVVGVSGSVQAGGYLMYDTGTVIQIPNTTTATVDTTAPIAIDLTATCSKNNGIVFVSKIPMLTVVN